MQFMAVGAPNIRPFVPPKEPQVIFPFFSPNGESYLTMIERDDVVASINEITKDPVLIMKII